MPEQPKLDPFHRHDGANGIVASERSTPSDDSYTEAAFFSPPRALVSPPGISNDNHANTTDRVEERNGAASTAHAKADQVPSKLRSGHPQNVDEKEGEYSERLSRALRAIGTSWRVGPTAFAALTVAEIKALWPHETGKDAILSESLMDWGAICYRPKGPTPRQSPGYFVQIRSASWFDSIRILGFQHPAMREYERSANTWFFDQIIVPFRDIFGHWRAAIITASNAIFSKHDDDRTLVHFLCSRSVVPDEVPKVLANYVVMAAKRHLPRQAAVIESQRRQIQIAFLPIPEPPVQELTSVYTINLIRVLMYDAALLFDCLSKGDITTLLARHNAGLPNIRERFAKQFIATAVRDPALIYAKEKSVDAGSDRLETTGTGATTAVR